MCIEIHLLKKKYEECLAWNQILATSQSNGLCIIGIQFTIIVRLKGIFKGQQAGIIILVRMLGI